MLLDELLESVIMAAHALNEKDASKSLDEAEGEEEKDDFGEFNKYIERIAKNSKSLEELLKKELGNNEDAQKVLLPFSTTRQLLLGMREKIADPKTDFQDPKNQNAKILNSTLQNFMINLVSLRRGLESLAEWSKGLDKIGIKPAQLNKLFGFVQKESMIHNSSLSSLLLEINQPKDYPAGSIAKAIANLDNFDVNLKDVFDPDGREHKLVINYFKKLDDNIGKLEKTLGNKKALESEIDKFFKTRPGQGVIAAAWSFAKSMVASFFKPAPIGDGTILNARQAMGSIEEPSGLLFLSPKQIIDINEKVNTGLKDMKKNVSIVRDMLAFGGKDADRIQAYIKDNEIEADDYLENLDPDIDWAKDKDYNKLLAAMISSDYYGESHQVQKNLIHKNTMQNLLFEDAEEFVDLWNQFLSKGNNITQKTKTAGTLLFPKLSKDYDWNQKTQNWEKKKELDMDFPEGGIYGDLPNKNLEKTIRKIQNREPLEPEEEAEVKKHLDENPFDKEELVKGIKNIPGLNTSEEVADAMAEIISQGKEQILTSEIIENSAKINAAFKEKGLPYEIEVIGDAFGVKKLETDETKQAEESEGGPGKTKVSKAAMKALFPDKDKIITQALAALGNYELIESNNLLHKNSLAQLLSEEKKSLLKYIVSYYGKNAIDQTQKHWEKTPGAKNAALKRLNNMLIQKKDVLKEKGIDLEEEIEIAEEEVESEEIPESIAGLFTVPGETSEKHKEPLLQIKKEFPDDFAILGNGNGYISEKSVEILSQAGLVYWIIGDQRAIFPSPSLNADEENTLIKSIGKDIRREKRKTDSFLRDGNLLKEDAKDQLYKNLADNSSKEKAKEIIAKLKNDKKLADQLKDMGLDLEGNIDAEDPPYPKEDWVEILQGSYEEEGFPEKLIDPLADVLAGDDFKDTKKTDKNLVDAGLPFKTVEMGGESGIDYVPDMETEKQEKMTTKALQKEFENLKAYKDADKGTRNRVVQTFLNVADEFGASVDFRLGESLHRDNMLSLMFEEREISYLDFEDAFEKDLSKNNASEDEISAALELLKKLTTGLRGSRVRSSLEKKYGLKLGKSGDTSKPRTGITIQDKRWNQAKKIFYQKAKSKAAKYAKDSGGTAGIQQKVLKDEGELTAMMKSFNSISKETQGLKAPIFPEGKRRPKSKLIHKRSLTEALFSDDD